MMPSYGYSIWILLTPFCHWTDCWSEQQAEGAQEEYAYGSKESQGSKDSTREEEKTTTCRQRVSWEESMEMTGNIYRFPIQCYLLYFLNGEYIILPVFFFFFFPCGISKLYILKKILQQVSTILQKSCWDSQQPK